MTATKAPVKGTTKAPVKAPVDTSVEKPTVESPIVEQVEEQKPKPKKQTAAQRAKAAKKEAPMGYVANAEGRVFINNEMLNKQRLKRKFGLRLIGFEEYEEALKNGGLTAPIEDELEGDL